MSVNWSWKAKKGAIAWVPTKEAKNEGAKAFKWNFYQANCIGCFLYEYKDKETNKDMYKFMTFFNDWEHVKRCLGLVKTRDGYKDNLYKEMYSTHTIKEIRLNTYYKDNLKLADLFTRAGFKVKLYYKEIK